MMTGAFAQATGLTVRYRTVFGDECCERAGDLAIKFGHVNLTLEERLRNPGFPSSDRDPGRSTSCPRTVAASGAHGRSASTW